MFEKFHLVKGNKHGDDICEDDGINTSNSIGVNSLMFSFLVR